MRRKSAAVIAVLLLIAVFFSSVSASSYKTLRFGDSGEAVLALKARMYELGYFASDKYSDTYNETTVERVRLLQAVNGLEKTGIATPELQELIFSDACIPASGTPVPAVSVTPAPAADLPGLATETPAGYRTLSEGDSGKDVLLLKQRMYWLGYFISYNNLSDKYNDVMADRIRDLQRNNSLQETGIATPELQAFVYSDAVIPTDNTPSPTATPKPTPVPLPTAAPVTTPELPELAQDGFLSDDSAESEFIFADRADGHWIYLSHDLAIEIKRYSDPNLPLVWFETDVRIKDDMKLVSYLSGGKKPGSNYVSPVDIARGNKVVLGFTDDFFGYRLRNDITMGIIIRNGKILSDKTYKANRKSWPCLETLAVFADGSMKTYLSDEYTAQEYLDMGALNVLSFGPVLVANGQIGPHLLERDYYRYKEPRSAMGMIEPGHYIVLTVNGRSGDSDGAYLTWLANRMLLCGAKEALNLDGGGTVALVFMGEHINKGGTANTAGNSSIRKVTSIIGFGYSGKVPD